MAEQILDISWKTIIKISIAGFILYAFYLAKDIVLWFFFALIISVLLEPAVIFLRWLRVPKILAITMVYLAVFGFFGVLIYVTAPIFIFELRQFSQLIPEYIERVSPLLREIGVNISNDFNSATEILIKSLEQGSKSVLNAAAVLLGGLFSAFFILVLSFFLSIEGKGLQKFLVFMAPQKYEERISIIFERVQRKVSGWFGARILACLFVGVASFIIFYIFGIKYALLLALIAGVLNFIPYIGPWVTAMLLIVFVGVASSSWISVVYVLVAFIVIQTIENSILTPILMKKMIDLPPVLVLIGLLVGAQLLGFLGALFAVPVFGIIYEFTKEFLERRRSVESPQLDQLEPQ